MILGSTGPGPETRAHLRNLRAIPYAIEIAYNGAPVGVGEITDLAVTVADDQVTYRFSVPLREPLRAPGVVDIDVDDPGLFTAFTLRDPAPTEVRSTGPFAADCARTRRPSGAPGPMRCVLRSAPR